MRMKSFAYLPVILLVAAVFAAGCSDNMKVAAGGAESVQSIGNSIGQMWLPTEPLPNQQLEDRGNGDLAPPEAPMNPAEVLAVRIDDGDYAMYLCVYEYEAPEGKPKVEYWYLGFYPDGTVIGATVWATEENPIDDLATLSRQVAEWLKIGHELMSQTREPCKFVGRELAFSTVNNSNGAVVDHVGSVDESGDLLIHFYGHKTGYSDDVIYRYVGVVDKDGVLTFGETFAH